MDKYLEEIIPNFEEINSEHEELLKKLENRKIPSTVADNIKAYRNNLENYKQLPSSSAFNEKSASSLIENLLSFIVSITSNLSSAQTLSDSEKKEISELAERAKSLRHSIRERPVTLKSPINSNEENSESSANYKNDQTKLNSIKSEIDSEKRQYAKFLKDINEKIDNLEKKGMGIYERVENEIQKTASLYEQTNEDLESKRETSNLLLEAISRDTFSGNYEVRAAREEEIADKLRTWSLRAMAIAILIIMATVIEASLHSYSLPNALLRFGLIFVVTVPAAYLAKESNKHREKHNTYLEKSLDLKALSPFIASLEKNEQDEIISRMADRLFGNTSKNETTTKEIPTNSVDALLEILEKVKNISKNSSKEN